MIKKIDKFFFGNLGNSQDRILFYGTLLVALLLCTFSFIVTGGN